MSFSTVDHDKPWDLACWFNNLEDSLPGMILALTWKISCSKTNYKQQMLLTYLSTIAEENTTVWKQGQIPHLQSPGQQSSTP